MNRPRGLHGIHKRDAMAFVMPLRTLPSIFIAMQTGVG